VPGGALRLPEQKKPEIIAEDKECNQKKQVKRRAVQKNNPPPFILLYFYGGGVENSSFSPG